MTTGKNWKNTLLLFIPGTLWGGSFWITKIVLHTFPPFTLTALRNLISALAMVILLYLQGGRLPQSWRGWRPLFIIGFFNNALPFALITWGQVYIDSGLASILVSTMPLFSIVLAHFLTTDEKLTSHKFGGVLLGFSGILVLIGPISRQSTGNHGWAYLAIIVAALCYSIGGLFVKRLMQKSHLIYGRNLSVNEIATGQFISSTFFLFPLSVLLEQPWHIQPNFNAIMALLALALPISIIAMQIYYHLIDASGASYAALTVYLIPINGVFWGGLILHEPITWQVVLATALILSGIAIVNGAFSLGVKNFVIRKKSGQR